MRQAGPGDFRWRAMASPVQLLVPDLDDARGMDLALAIARDMIESEQALSRFWPTSDLTRLNGALGVWTEVSERLRKALVTARRAERVTGGLFNPTVLPVLEGLGFKGSPLPSLAPLPGGGPWGNIRSREGRVVLRRPVDLGGIGKGLALRWSAEIARRVTKTFLINLGGDVIVHGRGKDGKGWPVAVEDPSNIRSILAVLGMEGSFALSTSSVARRRWTHGRRTVHHLIDPRTHMPAESDLLAVTVVHRDPVWADVHSKVLFFKGRNYVLRAPENIAALWVDTEGRVGWTREMAPLVVWLRETMRLD